MCRDRVIRIACKLAWGVLFAAHAYWFAGALASPETSTSSPLFLGITLVFFLLKLLDLPGLRVRWNRRTVLCAVMVVVLLHIQVFDQDLLEDANVSWLAVPAQLVTSLGPRLLMIVCAALLILAGCDDRGREEIRRARIYVRLALAAAGPRRRVRVLATTPLRAPPPSGCIFAG